MSSEDAERLHEGLVAGLTALLSAIDGATLEGRTGYRFMVTPGTPVPGLTGVWIDGGPDEDEAIAAELASAVWSVEHDLEAPCWIIVREKRTPLVEAESARLGFTHAVAMPGMVVTPEELRPGKPTATVRRVQDRRSLAIAERLATEGFELPPGAFASQYTDRVLELPAVEMYVAEADGEPVSTGVAFGTGRTLGIFNVATPPRFRRRGYAATFTATMIAEGFAAGDQLAWLQSSPEAVETYRSLGFRTEQTYLVMGRPSDG